MNKKEYCVASVLHGDICRARCLRQDDSGSAPVSQFLSFAGSLSSDRYVYPELMSLSQLQDYMGIYPDSEETYTEIYYELYESAIDEGMAVPEPIYEYDNYDKAKEQLAATLRDNILSGKWPDFPYVLLDGELYFSKAAVDEWFREKSGQQLTAGEQS